MVYSNTMVSSRINKRKSRSRSRTSKTKQIVYHRDATDGVKGWDSIRPKRISERRRLMRLCGSKCFGTPNTLKFPVCPIHIKNSKQCGVDCKGLLAAYARAR